MSASPAPSPPSSPWFPFTVGAGGILGPESRPAISAGACTGIGAISERLDLNVPGCLPPKRQPVTTQAKLHGIAQGGHADQLDRGAGCQAHIKKPAPQLAVSVNADDAGALIDCQFIKEHGKTGYSL